MALIFDELWFRIPESVLIKLRMGKFHFLDQKNKEKIDLIEIDVQQNLFVFMLI